ncbi:hypothetical protein C9374_006663 [Naegleria lovaniensis]|uniref:Uncharacterized protein n=1 Tax=Naegleria lovaniensis TaxID=51637 RepID=A0AA88GLW5_NAELO|nr:uncharacterized protein C9374_006663 [Naegleria lovaniensis]KAG2379546.1 hypothetical protein C9374_006663 [Naegleria lovaniensis]
MNPHNDHEDESVWYCGRKATAGCRFEQDKDGDCFLKLLYKPSSLSRNENVIFTVEKKHDDLPLKFSFICSGGEQVTYSLIFLMGEESKFFLSISNNLQYLRKVTFHELFQGMYDLNLDVPIGTSKEMKRVVCNNRSHVLFEMMDERFYVYDVDSFTMKPFKIHGPRELIAIGAGIMSPYFLLNTTHDPTQIVVYQCSTQTETTFEVPCETSKIKFMTSYCRDLFIFVLENNKFYIRKTSSFDAYGFISYPIQRMVYVKSPFEKDAPVVQVSTGFAHVAVLLQNGRVFIRGLNNYGQIPNTSGTDQDSFVEINTDAFPVRSLCCGSICTCLVSENGEIIFFGEVVTAFKSQTNIDPKFRKYNKIWVMKKEYPDQEVSLGPWHAFVYRKRINIKKADMQFFLKLKEIATRGALCDIAVLSPITNE